MPNRRINVSMLGDFVLIERDGPDVMASVTADLTGTHSRSWMMLAYLIMNEDRAVPVAELIELFLPESKDGYPATNLQNSINLIGNLLLRAGFADLHDPIAHERDSYQWDPGIKTVTDVRLFESQAFNFEKNGVMLDLEKAVAVCNMYHGNFLERAVDSSWCVNNRAYLRSVFMSLCRITVQGLIQEGRLTEAASLCMHAIDIDPAVEEFSVTLMKIYNDMGSYQRAIDHYEHIRDHYEKANSPTVSPQMEMEHERALKQLYGYSMGKEAILAFLEAPYDEGAFYCSNNVFREIVQLFASDMKRSGSKCQLATIGLRRAGHTLDEHAVAVSALKKAISGSLRAGDPFTKIGIEQFLILLPHATRENGEVVLRRIKDNFLTTHPDLDEDLFTSIFELLVREG